MNRAVKWSLIAVTCLIVVIIAALLIAPRFVNVKKYKPQIEERIAQATGRTFSVGDDLELTLLPWAGLSFSDLELGSLEGFEEKHFVTVKAFEVRVKLLPLISKDIQIKRFLLKGARIVLEKSKDGRVNWKFGKEAPVQAKPKIAAEKTETPAAKPDEELPLKSLVVGDFTVTEGSILWIDHTKGQRKEVSDVNLKLKDVSLERPLDLVFSAQLDGKPLAIQGSVGPLGKDLGKGDVPVDLAFKALEQLEARLKGRLINPTGKPQFDLNVDVSPFSPRKLLAALQQPFPAKTADPKALDRVAFKAKVAGDNQRISVSDGTVDIDASKLKFALKAQEFSKPNVSFKADLDHIDLDRYLPPEEKKASKSTAKGKVSDGATRGGTSGGKTKGTAAASGKKPVDYAPLRRLVLNGAIKIGKLKVKNAHIQNIDLKVTGKKGIFRLDPLKAALYQGTVSGKGGVNVQKNTPKTKLDLDAKEIQVSPLLNDVLKKDFLEGVLKAQINIALSGDTPEAIKKTISGDGDLLFKDGAIKGIDLAGMVRNAKAAFGKLEKEKGAEKPKTDFTELRVPFTLKRGLFNTTKTVLASPLIRVSAAGEADLVGESLDFRVEPKFVATIKGQGDTKKRSGIVVPVLISGTFKAPKFKPDLEGMIKKRIDEEIPILQQRLMGGDKPAGESGSFEDKVKGFFRSLPKRK
jgi:AsmA protein